MTIKNNIINRKKIISNKKYNDTNFLFYFINQLSLFFICTWMIWPYFTYKLGILPLLFVFVMWLFTVEGNWYIKGWSLDLFCILVWYLTFIPYILTKNFEYGNLDPINTLQSFILFTMGMFLINYYLFYKKDYLTITRFGIFTLFILLVGSIQTILGLKEYPLASRELATGNAQNIEIYNSIGIGGFGYIYSVVFIIPLCLFLLKNVKRMKKKYLIIIYLLLFITLIFMVIQASYALALIFTIAGIILTTIIRGKKSLVFWITLTALLIIIIPKEVIGYLLASAAILFQNNITIYSKLMDLSSSFIGLDSGTQTFYRFNLYYSSFKTFTENPLFGIYGPFGDPINSEVGGHSGWIDLLAYYGIFGSLPLFLAILINFRKCLSIFKGEPYYYYLSIIQKLFILFGFINPVIYIFEIGFVLFAIAPSLPFIVYNSERNSHNYIDQ